MTMLPLRVPRLILRSAGYEMRKRIQFRTGFFVREVLFGTVEPLIMLFVYGALYASAGGGDVVLGGWTFDEILRYVAGLLVVRKLIFHNRGIELSTEIFEGRVTKYLVMPLRYFALLQGRFLQYTLLQVVIAGLVWAAGYGLVGDLNGPGEVVGEVCIRTAAAEAAVAVDAPYAVHLFISAD